MSLIDHIGSVEAAINLTKNPDSRNHLMSILTLLYQAKELWTRPGGQAEAQRLEQEARDLLQNTNARASKGGAQEEGQHNE